MIDDENVIFFTNCLKKKSQFCNFFDFQLPFKTFAIRLIFSPST